MHEPFLLANVGVLFPLAKSPPKEIEVLADIGRGFAIEHKRVVSPLVRVAFLRRLYVVSHLSHACASERRPASALAEFLLGDAFLR